ncbi:protein MAIN-LIKE 2-like [Telopea speciosissima]|uniref:protein MAIN-LIKE 2-like n=1 Tax=Telopea speciosissima TaxID=54955 RepID=UPI001CC4E55F|nr:protein MAIN-LIKE 2-like [Telopea speciosissima]
MALEDEENKVEVRPSSSSFEVTGDLKVEWYPGSIQVDTVLHKCCTIWGQALKKSFTPNYKKYCRTNNVLSWYQGLHLAVTERVDLTNLGCTAQVVSPKLDTPVVHALTDRWWPSTHTFHLPAGEVTITPLDFFMIMGIPFSRRPISLTHSVQMKSLGEISDLLDYKATSCVILLTTMKKEWDNQVIDDSSPKELFDQAAKSFLLYLVSNVLFCDGGGRRDTFLACFFEDFEEAESFDWGGSVYAHFLKMLDRLTFSVPGLIGCAYDLWVWCYEVLGIHAPCLPNEAAPYIPQATRWGKAMCSFIDELQYLGRRPILGEYGLPPSHGYSVNSCPSHAVANSLPIAQMGNLIPGYRDGPSLPD